MFQNNFWFIDYIIYFSLFPFIFSYYDRVKLNHIHPQAPKVLRGIGLDLLQLQKLEKCWKILVPVYLRYAIVRYLYFYWSRLQHVLLYVWYYFDILVQFSRSWHEWFIDFYYQAFIPANFAESSHDGELHEIFARQRILEEQKMAEMVWISSTYVLFVIDHC